MDTYSFFTRNGLHGAFWRYEKSIEYYFPEFGTFRPRVVDVSIYDYFDDNLLSTEDGFISHAVKSFGYVHPIQVESIERSLLPLNGYHPRVWRGNFSLRGGSGWSNPINNSDVYGDGYISALVAADSVFNYLVEVFRFIDPTYANLRSYGARLRELLILACTEVEGLWKGVLRANSSVVKKRYKTDDYYQVCELLRLKEWVVYLKDYPSIGEFSPFFEWSAEKPSQSLAWYEAYNSVKHDRERAANQANLKNLINAVAALHILNLAQWGPEVYSAIGFGRNTPFAIRSLPKFKAAELYSVSSKRGELMALRYFD